MPLQNYNANTVGEQGDTYRSGSSWMRPSLLMQREEESKSGVEPVPGYTTIDDVIRIAKELLAQLDQLGEYKHPFDVRRGRKEGVKMVERDEDSKTLKAGAKTYFLDIRETKGGKPYLMITESQLQEWLDEHTQTVQLEFSLLLDTQLH
jgi:hypothetical protein